jgi:hypothetical protein
MGILKKIFGGKASIQQLPAGTVTVDRHGHIITSTVSSAFPEALLQDIGREISELLREARLGQIPMSEVSLHYGSLRITAREMRGGAIIFLFPKTALSNTPIPVRS